MTYTGTIVLDTTIQGGQIYVSESFTNPRFLLIDTVNLPQEEKLDLGFSLIITIPIIGRTIEKNIALLPETIVGVFDTFYIIPIPNSLYLSQYECRCAVSFPADAIQENIRIYVYTSDISEETTNDKLDQLLDQLTTVQEVQAFDVLEDVAQITNSIQNNIAFGVLSAALVPITGGTSAGALPALTTGTGALSVLALPGL